MNCTVLIKKTQSKMYLAKKTIISGLIDKCEGHLLWLR